MNDIKCTDIERLINTKETLQEKRKELLNIYTESYGKRNKRKIERKMDEAIYIFDSKPTESEFFLDKNKTSFNETIKYSQIKEEAEDYKLLKRALLNECKDDVLTLLKKYFPVPEEKEEKLLNLNFQSYSSETYRILLNPNVEEETKKLIRKQREKYQESCHELGVYPVTDYPVIDNIISKIKDYKEDMIFELVSKSKFIQRKQQEIYDEKGIIIPAEKFAKIFEDEEAVAAQTSFYDRKTRRLQQIVYFPILAIANYEKDSLDRVFLHENRHLLESGNNIFDYYNSRMYNGLTEIRTEKNAIQDLNDITPIFTETKKETKSLYDELFPLCGDLFEIYRNDFNKYFFNHKILQMERRAGSGIQELAQMIDEALNTIIECDTQGNNSEIVINNAQYLEKVEKIKGKMKRKSLFLRPNYRQT